MRALRLSRDALLWFGLTVVPLTLLVVLLRLIAWTGPRRLDGATGVEVALADGVVVLVAGAGVAALLSVIRVRWLRRAIQAALGVAALAMVVVAVLQYGYVQAFGISLDAPTFATHLTWAEAHHLWPIVAAELDPFRVGLFLLPPLYALAAWWWASRPRRRAWAARAERPSVGPALAVYALPVVLVAAGAAPGVQRGEIARTVASLRHTPDWGPAPTAAVPLFDAAELRLVETAETRRRDVVLIVLESLRARSTTPTAPELDTTPVLDSLARRGWLVEHMTTTTPYTNKALGALLAGTVPTLDTRVIGIPPLPVTGLPELLRPHGYRSGFFTPASVGYEDKGVTMRRLGFDTVVGAEALAGERPRSAYPTSLGLHDPAAIGPALDWASAAREDGAPFFLTFLTLSGHYPYRLPAGAPRSAQTGDARLDAYLDGVRYTDATLGALVSGLDARGLLRDAVVVVVGDHGEAFGEHGEYVHGDVLWEEALHVPAVVLAPGVQPRRIAGTRQLTDVLPTLADLLGLKLADGVLPGRSLRAPPDSTRLIGHATRHPHLATVIRRGAMKVRCERGCGRMQAFDLATDPMETRDLAAGWSHGERVAWARRVAAWRTRVDAAYE